MKTTAIPVSRLRLPSRFHLRARLPDLATLMKPRVMVLAVFTVLVGLMIALGDLDPLLGSVMLTRLTGGEWPNRTHRLLPLPA